MMQNDPDMTHLSSKDYRNVYEPGDDSWLLMDSIREDLGFIEERLERDSFCLCMEIGCGSGIISSHVFNALKAIGRTGLVMSVDINQDALSATQRTFQHNQINGELIRSDLAGALGETSKGSVDILVFNPPYVPTEEDEMNKDDIFASWAGGKLGREVTDRFVPDQAEQLLSERGVFYLVLIEANKPEQVIERMESRGFKSKLLKQKKSYREKLRIYRFWKQK